MAHEFPEITTYGAALRFALEAEQACADFAAAAGVVAPTQEWQDKLEEIVCTHDDRVQKLMAAHQGASDLAARPVGPLDRSAYLGALDAEPATSWPAIAEQLARAEEDAARYHDAFVARCGDILAAGAHHFTKSASQDRDYSAQLREMLG